METKYTKIYMKELLTELRENAKDAEKWSVYNGDVISDEVQELKDVIKKIREKI